MEIQFVAKSEVAPYKQIFLDAFYKVQKECRKQHGLTFNFNLVGSAKRNMVVRHHNKGFDLDYQLFLQKNKKGLTERQIKNILKILFDKYFPSDFNNCEDSTSAITIKKVLKDKIEIGYDIVILKSTGNICEIIRRKGQEYFWNELPDTKNYISNLSKIKGPLWARLKNIYGQKIVQKHYGQKYQDKKSFQILNEAINEVLK
jgi:hypothetical protein